MYHIYDLLAKLLFFCFNVLLSFILTFLYLLQNYIKFSKIIQFKYKSNIFKMIVLYFDQSFLIYLKCIKKKNNKKYCRLKCKFIALLFRKE